jgi:hypothetical protein
MLPLAKFINTHGLFPIDSQIDCVLMEDNQVYLMEDNQVYLMEDNQVYLMSDLLEGLLLGSCKM